MREEKYTAKVSWTQHYVGWNHFKSHIDQHIEEEKLTQSDMKEAAETIARIMKM